MNLRTSELSLRNGYAFMGTTQVQGLVIGNTHLRFVINNPAGSNRNIVLAGMVIDNNLSGMLFGTMKLNPTNAPATTAGQVANQILGSSKASVATIFSDAGATALNGTTIATFGVPGGERTTYDEVAFILPPGNTIGVDVSFSALLASAQGDAMVYWQEEMLQ